jgi:hypothetical protein
MTLVALALVACREKPEQVWLEEIRKAADEAETWEEHLTEFPNSAVGQVKYQIAAERLENLKQRAISDGADEKMVFAAGLTIPKLDK